MIPRGLMQVRRVTTVPPKFFPEPDSLTAIQKRVLFKDENFIAINKPYGLASTHGPKVKLNLANHLHKFRFENRLVPNIIHRLDEGTTGVLVMSRHPEAARMAMNWFKKKQIKKVYHCLVLGRPEKSEGVVDVPLKVGMTDPDHNEKYKYIMEANVGSEYGKEAITMYKCLETFEGPNGTFSFLEVQPVTGRRHQLRVHCCDVLKCPIVGDHIRTQHKLYTNTHLKGLRIKRKHLPLLRMHLHASRVELPPDSSEGITEPTVIEAPLPEHMKTSLSWLRENENWHDPYGPILNYAAGRDDVPQKKKKRFINSRHLPEDYEEAHLHQGQQADRIG
eukprot:scpid74244/ scgid19923/ RNA pseudouridylate synthase domain-containing protein 4